MAQQTRTYQTLRPFPHHGRVIPAGGEVELHPSQAKYYLGTHLSEPTTLAKTTTSAKSKSKAEPTTTTEGDQ